MPFNLKLAACPAVGLLSKLEPCGTAQGALQAAVLQVKCQAN